MVGIEGGDFHGLEDGAESRVAFDVGERGDLGIEIDFARGGEGFADRPRLDNGHPKEIEE